MMRTSNFFPLARRYSKQKARSRVQSTTNGGKALYRVLSFLWWVIKRKMKKCFVMLYIFIPTLIIQIVKMIKYRKAK